MRQAIKTLFHLHENRLDGTGTNNERGVEYNKNKQLAKQRSGYQECSLFFSHRNLPISRRLDNFFIGPFDRSILNSRARGWRFNVG